MATSKKTNPNKTVRNRAKKAEKFMERDIKGDKKALAGIKKNLKKKK